jgi:hypothetical protein
MPAAIPIIGAVVSGVASMVNSNVQNKAAIKNNENQQAAAVANAKQANATAFANQNAYTANNPDPTNAQIGAVPGSATSAPTVAGQPATTAMSPQSAAATAQAKQKQQAVATSILMQKLLSQQPGVTAQPQTVSGNPSVVPQTGVTAQSIMQGLRQS